MTPVMVAIGGDSGTGKTTLVRGLSQIFGPDNVVHICLDDYHTLDRVQRKRAGITALNPAANDITLMEEHVWALREGRTVVKPVYDHATGTFGSPVIVVPRPIVVVRGLFPLFTERLRRAFDVAVWLDPDEELKYHWKLQRDVAQRGYTVEAVIRQIIERQEDVRRYILPQRAYADMTIRFWPPAGFFSRRDRNGEGGDCHLGVQIRQAAPLFPRDLLTVAEEENGDDPPAVRYRCVESEGSVVGELEIDGSIASERARRIEESLVGPVNLFHREVSLDCLGTYVERGGEPRRSAVLALTQLLVAYRVVTVRDGTGSSHGREWSLRGDHRGAHVLG